MPVWPGGGRPHARVGADRRDPLGRLRRIRCRCSRRPDRGLGLAPRVLRATSRIARATDVPLKGIVDEASSSSADRWSTSFSISERANSRRLVAGRDLLWPDFLARGEGGDGSYVALEANEPAWILATSGTTAKPKLTVQRHGGYAVGIHAMGRWCFGMKRERRVVGDLRHRLGRRPQLHRLRAARSSAARRSPTKGRSTTRRRTTLWRLVEELRRHRASSRRPTAVRLLMRYGEEPARGNDLSSLERIVCAGEVLNPPASEWLQNDVLRGPHPGDRPLVADGDGRTRARQSLRTGDAADQARARPASRSPAWMWPSSTPEGEPCAPNEKGILVIRRPFPSLTATLWGEPERYGSRLLGADPRRLLHRRRSPRRRGRLRLGRGACRRGDQDRGAPNRDDRGRDRLPQALGRCRGGRHRTARRAARRGDLGLRRAQAGSRALRSRFARSSSRRCGTSSARSPSSASSTSSGLLPKTRSGKIMRRVLKAVVLDQDPGDIATIEDEGSVDEARQAWQEMLAEAGSGSTSRTRPGAPA